MKPALKRSLYAVLALAFAAAVYAQHDARKSHHAPHGPAGVATFDVSADGDTIHVLAGSGVKGDPALGLWHRRSDDGGRTWSEAVRVNRGGEAVFAPHPGENPQIAARGVRVIATWTLAGAQGGHGGGPIATALSADGGKSWRAGPNPADDRSTRYHGLLELVATPNAWHLVWLHGTDRRQGLHYASSTDDGATWKASRVLDDYTCNCCWNRVVTGPGSAIGVLYRGGEPRDMMLATSSDGASWKRLGAVGGFGWAFNGCPHVGGALALGTDGRTLHALVWTGRDGAVGLYHLASTNGGASWSAPRRIGSEEAKNADLALAADGTLVAVWDQLDGATSTVYRAQSRDGGKTWTSPERLSDPALRATYPRLAATQRGVAVFWLETRPGSGAALKADGRELAFPAPSSH